MSLTTEVQVSELTGQALDFAAGQAAGLLVELFPNFRKAGFRVLLAIPFVIEREGRASFHDKSYRNWLPSTNTGQGGELLHKLAVALEPEDPFSEFGGGWWAVRINAQGERCRFHGETPLIAGMRAIVGAANGNTVNIPKELLEQKACSPE